MPRKKLKMKINRLMSFKLILLLSKNKSQKTMSRKWERRQLIQKLSKTINQNRIKLRRKNRQKANKNKKKKRKRRNKSKYRSLMKRNNRLKVKLSRRGSEKFLNQTGNKDNLIKTIRNFKLIKTTNKLMQKM